MNSKVSPIPNGLHTLTPYLIVKGAADAIDFYKRAFGATEQFRMPSPDGKSIGHASIIIGNSVLMMADESPHMGAKSPQSLGGVSVSMVLYVPDVDAAFKRAADAGATVKMPVENKFYGDRMGTLMDPFGHMWTIGTHIEDVTPQEMQRRMQEFCSKMGDKKNM